MSAAHQRRRVSLVHLVEAGRAGVRGIAAGSGATDTLLTTHMSASDVDVLLWQRYCQRGCECSNHRAPGGQLQRDNRTRIDVSSGSIEGRTSGTTNNRPPCDFVLYEKLARFQAKLQLQLLSTFDTGAAERVIDRVRLVSHPCHCIQAAIHLCPLFSYRFKLCLLPLRRTTTRRLVACRPCCRRVCSRCARRPCDMPVGASGEDVDLFLEEELWIDVKLRDNDIQQLVQILEGQRQHHLHLHQLHATNPASHPAPPQPPSTTAVTAAAQRRWHEAEVRAVDGRNIRVHFLNIPLPPQWINVDEGWERLSELHVMTEREREGRAEKREECDLTVDADDVFEEVVQKARLESFVAAELRNGERLEYEVRLQQAKEEFIRRWFTSSSVAASSSSSSSSVSIHSLGSEGKEEEVEMFESEDVVSESVTIPLFDQLTHCRLVVPVRTAACTHCNCLDLMTHIQQQKAKLEWTCCLCGKEAYANQLEVDLYLFAILQAVRDGEVGRSGKGISHEFGEVTEMRQVVINRDGSWRVDDRAERDRKKRKRAAMEGAAASQSATSSSASSPVSISHIHSGLSPSAAALSSSSSSPSASSFSCPFPVELHTIMSDDVEYIDVRDDHPSDAAILAWLMQHIQVKQEKLAADRAGQQKQPIEESKSPYIPYQPTTPFIMPAGMQYPFPRPVAVGSTAASSFHSPPSYPSVQSYPLPSSHPRLLSSYTVLAFPSRGIPTASSIPSSFSPSPSSLLQQTASRSGRPATHHSRRTTSVVTLPPAPQPSQPPDNTAPLNINTCTEWQLRRVGLTPTLSEKIIAARKARGDAGFQTIEELRDIKGVGAKTYSKLREKVVI